MISSSHHTLGATDFSPRWKGPQMAALELPVFLPAINVGVESQVPHAIEQAISALGLQPLAARGGIAKSLSEALRNVFEHARTEDGASVAVSYFPKTERIPPAAVVDTGVGVPATIRPRHGRGLSDADHNLLATEVTVFGARPSPRHGGPINNAGIGLDYLRTVSARSNGQFALMSGKAVVLGGTETLYPLQ